MENYELVFTDIHTIASAEVDEEIKTKVSEVTGRHEGIFDAWADILPLLRSPRLLTTQERIKLLDDVDHFINVFVANSKKGSITVKMHHLLIHLRRLLEEFGTIGLFAEDGAESIHAIVNTLARRFASLDKRRRIKQIVRSLEQRKKSKQRNQKEEKEAGCEKKKRSRVQGQRKQDGDDVVFIRTQDTKLKAVVDGLLDLFFENELLLETDGLNNEDDEVFPTFLAVQCELCQDRGEVDRWVPDMMTDLHESLCHRDVGNKKMKKAK